MPSLSVLAGYKIRFTPMASNIDPQQNTEAPEAQLMPVDAALREAEVLLRRRPHGVLCSLSKKADGWPFGSVVPYAVDADGRPIILIATIAEHTKNIGRDNRVSLLVHAEEGDGDVQERGRLTIMGRATPVPEDRLGDARARYLARLPEAADYAKTHSFVFHEISVERMRYIGGFGKIFWLPVDRYHQHVQDDLLAKNGKGVIEHMNDDHQDALRLYCKAFAGVDVASPEMTHVDRWGLDVFCPDKQQSLRFEFERPADPKSIRPIVVKMVNDARKSLGISK